MQEKIKDRVYMRYVEYGTLRRSALETQELRQNIVGDSKRVTAPLAHTAEERSSSGKADVSHIDLVIVKRDAPYICPLQCPPTLQHPSSIVDQCQALELECGYQG